MRKILAAILVALGLVALGACASSDAEVVNQNLDKDADNYKVYRQIVFYNGVTGEYIAEVSGWCSVKTDSARKVSYTCRIGKDKYIRNGMGLSDNVTWMYLQADPVNVSKDHFKVVLKPSTVIPNFEVR